MKLFDVAANIIAALLVWLFLTAIILFFANWRDYGPTPPEQPWINGAITILSALSFGLYARRYLKKLDR